jgi:hypothetical protein
LGVLVPLLSEFGAGLPTPSWARVSRPRPFRPSLVHRGVDRIMLSSHRRESEVASGHDYRTNPGSAWRPCRRCGGVAFSTVRVLGTAGQPTVRLALSTRHPSPDCWDLEADPESRQPHANYIGSAACAAIRAGRSGSRAGVLRRRSPAMCAGGTVQLLQSVVMRPQASPAWPLADSNRWLLKRQWASKRGQQSRILPMRTGGTRRTSTTGR